jgi:hypothetical protein
VPLEWYFDVDKNVIRLKEGTCSLRESRKSYVPLVQKPFALVA